MTQWQLESAPLTAGRGPTTGRGVAGSRAAALGSRRAWSKSAPLLFSAFAALAEGAVIVLSGEAANRAYALATLGRMPPVQSVAAVGWVVALLFILASLQRDDYSLQAYRSRSGILARTFPTWNVVFLAALALGFATKTTADYSRAGVAVFYVLAFVGVAATRRGLVEVTARLGKAGWIAPRRVVVVGFEDQLEELRARPTVERRGFEVASMIALRDYQSCLADDLALAAAAVRVHRADVVFIAVPWSRQDVIEAATEAFLRTPAQIHVGGDRMLERFSEARVERVGDLSGLKVTRAPMSRLQHLEKRLFDIAVAGAALVALSPLLLLTAILVRLESAGPALFRQTRYGFNQEPFRIFKFRSMRTMEDGAKVVSATRGDPRVTRVGAFIRRKSIDELPQLLNVLSGEMSIVGPRPHAVAHDQRYVERLARYARRHNVKPGITGWAQVHGHRGEITNDREMRDRLTHDLYYVDNWSLWLDIKIVFMTAFSSATHKNAF